MPNYITEEKEDVGLKKSVTVPMPDSLEMRMRLLAASMRVSRASLMRKALKTYLDMHIKIVCSECNSDSISHIGDVNYRCEDCGHHFGV